MNHFETEVKLAWSGTAAEARASIESCGYSLQKARQLETDVLFDRAGELRQQRQVLRLRRISNGENVRAIITYKGQPREGPHKVREEIEFEASEPSAVELVLNRLGYSPGFRYEKYRSTFSIPGEPGIVTLDEVPIGVFLELEGPAHWIDDTARRLGFTAADYVTSSYAALYQAYRARHPQAPPGMVFQN